MKTAQLHTGDVLEFPDMTPDDAIDATVANHLKVHSNNEARKKKEQESSSPQPQQQGSDPRQTMALMQHQEQLHNRDLQAHAQMHATSEMKHDAQHQQIMMAHAGANQSTAQMTQLLAANTQLLGQVKQSLDELAAIVSTAVDTVTKIMKSPKNLKFDNRGRPISAVYGGDDSEPDEAKENADKG
jgi:hypothetical protein